ncbi:hypothetical protein H0H92_013142 [Tricholoma furcatifolium]|nr:hypothetical protein H0H92_013142 [Tricholoma furcatifolium]
MHFSKTYAQLLLSLPPELRENAIQYRQLKKLINQIVLELASLGLSPALLQELLESSKAELGSSDGKLGAEVEASTFGLGPAQRRQHLPKVVYEVTDGLGHIEPHLRLWVDSPTHTTPTLMTGGSTSRSTSSLARGDGDASDVTENDYDVEEDCEDFSSEAASGGQMSLLWRLQRQALPQTDELADSLDNLSLVNDSLSTLPSYTDHDYEHEHTQIRNMKELVIPLASDMLFFQNLSNTINGLSTHLDSVQHDFIDNLTALSRTIGDCARPTSSSTTGFQPHSILSTKPWNVSNPSKIESDLYAWREIFQLYVEAEVFEGVHEADRGEHSVEESENRLKLFAERVTSRGLGDDRKLKGKSSRDALETFLELNMFILNIKKFQFANAEATRKILKKHTKRTSLTFLTDDLSSQAMVLPNRNTAKLPRILVQAIGETLLPIIPHLDDYSCLICTSIAFKPIRLHCGHLFCDWFPIEAHEKMTQNQEEAAKEQLEELGLDPNQSCRVM